METQSQRLPQGRMSSNSNTYPWPVLVVPAHERQEDQEFEVILVHIS